MKTLWGLTGIGLATFALFAFSVGQASADDPAPTVKEPVQAVRLELEPELRGILPYQEEAPLQRARRRVQARQWAEVYGLDAKDLVDDPKFFGRLYSRVGPSGYLAALKKQKAAALAKD